MSIFGWSYPPGCSSVPGDKDYPCAERTQIKIIGGTMKRFGETICLNNKQQKSVNLLIEDSRARYIELPLNLESSQIVKVLQSDGQQIGTITLKQAFRII